MKVLVTGCSGYIGSVLCRELVDRGHFVTGVDVRADGVLPLATSKSFTFIHAAGEDLADLYDAVVPLAGLVGAAACEKDPVTARRLNVDSVRQVAELSEWTVYLNTDSGYVVPEGKAAREVDPVKPRSTYAKLKHQAEGYVCANGGVSFRLGSVFGLSPSMRDDLLLHFMARQQGAVSLLEPNAVRAFVYVNDVVKAIIWALRVRKPGVFNLAYPVPFARVHLARQLGLSWSRLDGVDPDGRDYGLSCERLHEAGGPVPTHSPRVELPILQRYYRWKDAR